MKLAILSDLHLGDPSCSLLINESPRTAVPSYYLNPSRFQQLIDATGINNDYLILIGDIFDLSVATYSEAFQAAQVLFLALRKQGVTREVIFLPGNHDLSFWNTFLYEVNVINRIRKGKSVLSRWVIPAILDARPRSKNPGLTLYGVRVNKTYPKYGGTFIDHLSLDGPLDKGNPIVFNIAYPNLYFVTRDGQTFLLTHGHYFESYWSAASEVVKVLEKEDVQNPFAVNTLSVEDWVSLNLPMGELASANTGQAGKLLPLIRAIQLEVKNQKVQDKSGIIQRYLQRLTPYLNGSQGSKWYHKPRTLVLDLLLWKGREKILESLSNYKDTQNNDTFESDPGVSSRIASYLKACESERSLLNLSGFHLPPLTAMIYGHTHVPTLLGSEVGTSLTKYNTGGWLTPSPGSLCAPAVFTYEDGVLSSRLIPPIGG